VTLSAAWAKVKQPGPAWYWTCDAAHYGDLYQVCAFAAAFRDHFGWRFPLYLIATSRTQADVAVLFGPCFDQVIVAPGLQGPAGQWSRFYAEHGLPAFGLDTPIIIFPVLNPENAGMWDFTVEQNGLTVLPLIRRMLHLPRHAEPRPPPPAPDRQKAAQALCEQAGMVQGRSVVLCPYARSDPADAVAAFTLLAQALGRAGYSIFTSVAGDERAIAGTAPVRIPFSLLPDAAGYAGWIVAVRSGVADVVSSADCRKSIIYQSFHTRRNWGLAVLGLCRDAQELVFRFGADAPEGFTDAVIGGVPLAGRPARRVISDALRPARSMSFFDLDRVSLSAFLQKSWFARGAKLLRITDMPSRWHEQAWSNRREAIAALAWLAGAHGWQLLACRDADGWDFYEPVEAASLADGQYHWAGFWHTLLIVRRPSSADGTQREAVLPATCIAFGVEARPADALGSRAHRDRLTSFLPLCHGGLQFLDGWSELEDWGIWSVSCLSTLKILLPAVPAGPLGVRLAVTVAAFSILMPVMAFTVTANAIEAGRFELPGAAEPHEIEFLVPRQAVEGRRSILLRFSFPNILSPLQQDVGSADARTIGIGLHRLRVDLR
jgi:hypothetical protein